VYGPIPVFAGGFLIMGICSILCAVSQHYIMLLVFRAVAGIGAAMTVPPSVSLLVQIFTDPKEQQLALGIYSGFGGLGNMIGVVVGGALTTHASWRWIYYLTAIITIPLAVLSFFFLPKVQPSSAEKRSLDLPGIGVLTAGLILFVYAISDGNDAGWDSARVLATLIISIFLLIAFFFVERYVKDPAVPPSTWTNKNFTPLFFYTWRSVDSRNLHPHSEKLTHHPPPTASTGSSLPHSSQSSSSGRTSSTGPH
jgi:MFS family permease